MAAGEGAPAPWSDAERAAARDLLNLARAVTDSLTGEQVADGAAALGEWLPLLGRLNEPGVRRLLHTVADHADTLAEAVESVAAHARSGQLQAGLELLSLAGAVTGSVGDEAVAGAAAAASRLLVAGDRVAAEAGGVAGVERLAEAAAGALRDARYDRKKLGVMGLARALGEPEVQRTLRVALHLARKLGRGR